MKRTEKMFLRRVFEWEIQETGKDKFIEKEGFTLIAPRGYGSY